MIEQSHGKNKTINKIHRECERLNRLISQILDYSRLGLKCQMFEPINLNSLLDRILNDICFEYPLRTIEDNLLAFELSAYVLGALDPLAQIFENIIRNACKHTLPNASIKIDLKEDKVFWDFTCVDNGKGIDECELHRIIQPFYRAGNLMHTEGFGLGLRASLKMHFFRDSGLQVFAPAKSVFSPSMDISFVLESSFTPRKLRFSGRYFLALTKKLLFFRGALKYC